MISMEDFIRGIPKAELHLHIEGTFEPELMFAVAKRNNIRLRYGSVQEIRAAYEFTGLQDFLDIYYEGAGILTTEQDFYDLTLAYLRKARSQNVLHSEIFCDPQTHTARGVKFSTVMEGIHRAITDAAEESGISARLIICFLRHLDESAAMETLDEALAYKDRITAVGLDSTEIGHPPSKFRGVFDRARGEGFLTVAHAGEEGPAEYIRQALDLLKVSRIDHGIRCLDDTALIDELARRRIPLTVCPLSNLRLRVTGAMESHPVGEMMRRGLMVTINSDDPAYFGGYVNENYIAVAGAFNMTREDIGRLAKNSFTASFLSGREKDRLAAKVDEYMNQYG